jgi:predicted transposase/invertase (TIGR01784 family)
MYLSIFDEVILEFGREKAHEEGHAEGHEEGLQQGLEQGLEQGLQRGKRELARNLLDMDVDVRKIAQASGLSEEDLLSLRD